MSPNQAKEQIISYWMEKAVESLASAQSELKESRMTFAMNRAYYACFYAVSAVLLKLGKRFSKHSGVRSALHEHIVKTGKLSIELGKAYDRLFENRQEGDYLELVDFEKDQVEEAIQQAETFVSAVQELLKRESRI